MDKDSQLLVLVIDTNVAFWAAREAAASGRSSSGGAGLDSLTLAEMLEQLLLFANAHLMASRRNEVAVVVAHAHGAEYIVPSPAASRAAAAAGGAGTLQASGTLQAQVAAGMAEVLARHDDAARRGGGGDEAAAAAAGTDADALQPRGAGISDGAGSALAAALSLALLFVHRFKIKQGASALVGAAGGDGGVPASSSAVAAQRRADRCSARVLVLPAAADVAVQYVPMMNVIFR